MEGLTLREFGRQFGVTGEAVRKAINDGRIPAICVGKRSVGKGGREWPVIVDPARAAEHWGKNADPNQVRDWKSLSDGARRGWEKRRGRSATGGRAEPAAPAPRPAELGQDDDGQGASYNDWRRQTERFKALTAELEFNRASGKLVEASAVAADQLTMLTALRNRLRGVPSEAKALMPHLGLDDIEKLERLIDDALNDTADSVFDEGDDEADDGDEP